MQNNIPVFLDAIAAQEYAKNNPGVTITRDGDRFVIADQKSNYHYVKPLGITPSSILEHLNKYVISQENAKKEIAQNLYYHHLKSKEPTNTRLSSALPLMLVGPTGSGKTFIVQKACEVMDLPFLHVNTASMVPEGIKGYSIDTLGLELIKRFGSNNNKLESAVIFFDEIDKLYDSDAAEYGSKISAQLLRLLEGGELKVYEKESINTKNMLFILGGAFQSIIDEKSVQKNSMGFKNNSSLKQYQEIMLEDLYAYDVPKELLGRMGSIVNLHKLNEDDLYSLLTKSQNSPLQEYINKIEFHGCRVEISDETIRDIAKKAAIQNLGARGIRQILKVIFSDALFYAPDGRSQTFMIENGDFLKITS